MCPDTARHDELQPWSGRPAGDHPGRPAGFGVRSILVASLLGFRSPRTPRPLVRRHSEGRQDCHPCARTEVSPMFRVAHGTGAWTSYALDCKCP
jgi:hypothetical protein